MEPSAMACTGETCALGAAIEAAPNYDDLWALAPLALERQSCRPLQFEERLSAWFWEHHPDLVLPEGEVAAWRPPADLVNDMPPSGTCNAASAALRRAFWGMACRYGLTRDQLDEWDRLWSGRDNSPVATGRFWAEAQEYAVALRERAGRQRLLLTRWQAERLSECTAHVPATLPAAELETPLGAVLE